LALLCSGEMVVVNPNPGLDCAATLTCARDLGLDATVHPDQVELEGRGFSLVEPEQILGCGNSGTTLRLLSGVLAAQPFLSVLSGDASLNRRPVARLIEPLRRMGAELWARAGDQLPPLVVRGRPLRGIDYALPVASAQVASSILLAGLQAEGETTVLVPGPARDHTERLLALLGAAIEIEPLRGGGRRVSLSGPSSLTASVLRIPGDFSAAAFFFAAAAALPEARVTAHGVSLNPTRSGLLEVLEQMGATVMRAHPRVACGEEVADVTVIGPERLLAVDIPPEWLPRLIDEIPAWAIAAAVAAGRSRLRGAAELRVKESDRLAVLAEDLGHLGIVVEEHEDGIEIDGGTLKGGTVRAMGDHRIAMAFAVAGSLARGPVVVEEAEGIETSYPGFADTFRALGGAIEIEHLLPSEP
jgi:3-phosphoshikimate 1-carboxyvinyltransferase